MNTFDTVWTIIPASVRSHIVHRKFLNGMLELTYGHPARKYHNYGHLCDLLALATIKQKELQYNLDEFVAAIIFHDIIYDFDARSGINEQRSAEFANKFGPEIFPQVQSWSRVSELIIATIHTGTLTDPIEQWIADLDLSGLAVNYELFRWQNEHIIDEYCTIYPKPLVIQGRIQFLKTFLDRSFIYYSDMFSEDKARENMKRILEELLELSAKII